VENLYLLNIGYKVFNKKFVLRVIILYIYITILYLEHNILKNESLIFLFRKEFILQPLHIIL